MVSSHALWATLMVLALCAGLGKRAGAASAREGDAYVRGSADGRRWSIGTRAFEQVLEFRDGQLRLSHYRNRVAPTPVEYAAPGAPAPFLVEDRSDTGTFIVHPVWNRHLPGGAVADPASDGVRLEVKEGDLIGFGVGAHGDYTCDETQWVLALTYAGGETYRSSDDTTLGQGPMWHYYLRMVGSGFFQPLDAVEQHEYAGQKVRIASEPSGFRAPGGCPHIGPTKWHPADAYDAVRVWRAPRAGTISVQGEARNVGCGGAVDLSIFRLEPKRDAPPSAPGATWRLEGGAAQRVAAGGRPAVQLDLTLRSSALRVYHHVLAYPGAAVCRQWLELENVGRDATIARVQPLVLPLRAPDGFTQSWLVGGNSQEDQGLMKSVPVGTNYHQRIAGQATREHVPWTALHRAGTAGDGWFCALEYLGPWSLTADREGTGPLKVAAQAPDLDFVQLAPGERRSLPAVTLGVFSGDLDDMAARVYDWQYEYLWDYTNPDYYARPKWAVPWFYCSRNLQEQFAGRLAGLDMDADLMRQVGFEMLWDDAGWSTYPGWPEDSYGSVFRNTYEGPDFAQTLRYLEKMGMRWLAWFAGRPSTGVMDSKVASWGNFEWRTDAVAFSGLASDLDLRAKIRHFLDAHPRCSFHTCSGGSTYAHTFDIQRYANTNYFADFGRGPQTNYYFSYLDPPDKWVDIIEPWSTGGKYRPETARQLLTMVPMWGLYAAEEDREPIRRLLEIYHYLLREGVAGRWSRVAHPRVEGDAEFFYFQRLSRDRTRSCLVLKHRAPGPITLYPRGLLPEHSYVVGFESTRETYTRTGADLMERGVRIADQAPGELIYLGLPDRPGGGRDTTPPTAPGRVLSRREVNLGHSGVGIYWSPGEDDNWISTYEVRRGDQILGKASTGCYFFDHSAGWDPAATYAVRTVDGDGNTSAWTTAERLRDQPWVASALGGHFSERGRDGWSAETTTDGTTYVPMTWVPPARTPAGDMGGTPNQVGGVEGYWEGAGTARLGRGWQQASRDAACVRMWTAPCAGRVRVVGRAIKEWYRQERGHPLRVRILHNTRAVWPTSGWAEVPLKDLVGAPHDFIVHVAAGDALRFVLAPGDSPDDDLIAWMPWIEYEDEGSDAGPAASSTFGAVRILCGAHRAHTDSSGNAWLADRWYRGGRAMPAGPPVEGAQPAREDAALYQRGRQGREFTYTIPVPPGLYAVRLKFAEPRYQWALERVFDVWINGRRALADFDVVQIARGPRRAHERVFRYLVPNGDGNLVLRFMGGARPDGHQSAAMVQAIEVLPETKPVVRINAGSDRPFIDWNSFVWSADAHFEGGRTISSSAGVSQATPTLYDQALYQTARTGRVVRYRVPVPPGLYSVHLKFAELWLAEPGKRPMTVSVNGRCVREAWDPAAAAGQVGMAADVRAEDVTPDRTGHIVITVAAEGDHDAILQAIEIE